MAEEQLIEVTADMVCEGDGHWCSGAKSGPAKSWHLVVSRALTEDEREKVQAFIQTHRTWDLEDDDYSLILTWGVIHAVAPDVTIRGWYHRPYEIFVRGMRTPAKIYEILNATHFEAAKAHAKGQYREAFKGVGIPATIMECRKATAKDKKKMVALDE